MTISDDDPLARRLGELLRDRGARVAVMESTAGGLVTARILSVPGASAWLDRGAVAYSASAKEQMTGVDPALLREHGAVSTGAVRAMAEGLRALAGTDYAVAESGIAGPQSGRRSAKPVGSVAIAVAMPGSTRVEEHLLPGSRAQVMTRIAERVLQTLVEAIEAG